MKKTISPILMLFVSLFIFSCSNEKTENNSDNSQHGQDGLVVQTQPMDESEINIPTLPLFRYGINLGKRNQQWGDAQMGELAGLAGCKSARIKLPENHLHKWGYEIEIEDMKSYNQNGLNRFKVAYLITPTREHSTAPDSTEDWKLEHYIPKNLYEPIWKTDGTINPNNYWANYVFQTVSTYKDYIKIWEVWNEPDWVTSWKNTKDWMDSPPSKQELVRFNGSIFEYIRLLRITTEVAKKVDEEALIATGGIGYSSFLDAILRYTDNPKNGTITLDYPKSGAEYFDVLSFHHYPIYTDGNSDAGIDGYLSHFEELKNVLISRGVNDKYAITTESGAPRYSVDEKPGGEDYAKNYLLKLMIMAQVAKISGVDWFILSDSAQEGESLNPYHYMGLYQDVEKCETTSDAIKTQSGVAYLSLSTLLANYSIDHEDTQKLQKDLPHDAQGAVFSNSENNKAYILWAKTDMGENAHTSVLLTEENTLLRYEWDYSKTKSNTELTPSLGEHSIILASTPSFFITQ